MSGRLAALALALAGWAALGGCRCGGGPADPDGGRDAGDAGLGEGCEAPLSGLGFHLTEGLDGPRRLAIDATHAYFTETGSLPPGHSRLSRIPISGGARTELAATFTSADAVAVDERFAYLVDDSGVWRVDKETFQATLIGPMASNAWAGQTDIALTADSLVVSTGLRWLVRMAKDGTGRADLYSGVPGTAVRGATVEGSTVYFLVGGDSSVAAEQGLYSIPIDGSAGATRISTAPADARSLVLTPDAYVWAEGLSPVPGRVRALPRLGGAAVDLAAGLRAPAHPVRIGRFFYFQDMTDSSVGAPPTDLFLRRTSPCGQTGAAVAGPLGYGTGDLLWDGAVLYFTSAGVAGTGYVGRLP